MKTLNIIGAGRVGQTLGRLWTTSGVYRVQAVMTQSVDSARRALDFIGAGQAYADSAHMPDADVWMLTMPDTHIAPTAQTLAALTTPVGPLRPALAFHCSGALSSDVLAPLRVAGWRVASCHPLLSFVQPELALTQFAGTPCALEGDAPALAALQPAFKHIGGQCFALAAQDKLLYHAGAVFATNFLPVLQDVAEQLWQHCGMPEDLVRQMRTTLLQNAVNNILALGPKAALTGPAARGDVALVTEQEKAVAAWHPDTGAAYAALSQLASALARR